MGRAWRSMRGLRKDGFRCPEGKVWGQLQRLAKSFFFSFSERATMSLESIDRVSITAPENGVCIRKICSMNSLSR